MNVVTRVTVTAAGVRVALAGAQGPGLPSQTGNSGKVLGTNGTVTSWVAQTSGTGTVTSVASGNLTPLFTVGIATQTTTPAFTFTASKFAANKFYGGPTSGADATPTARFLVSADVPDLSGTYATVAGTNTFTGVTQIVPNANGNNGDDTPGYDGNDIVVAAQTGGDAGANPTGANAGGDGGTLILRMGAGGAGAAGGANGAAGAAVFQDGAGSVVVTIAATGAAEFNGSVTASSFVGTVSTATVASTVSSANEATDTTCFPLFITASGTQSLQPKNNTGFTFNSNTGALGATSFNGIIGSGTAAAGMFTTVTINSATSLLLGTAGSTVGSVGFRNATSGTITVQPTTGALGTITITLPATTGTVYVTGGTDVAVADGGTGLSSGTSGGVLAFTASGTIASSGALAANAIVVGGGAGVAPSTTTTGTGVLTQLANAANGTAADAIGYRGIPQNSQSAAYTTVMADNGKCIYHPSTDANNRTFTIDSNTNVALPIGATISFYNASANAVTIAITTDTLTLVGTGSTGSRTLAQYGLATAWKETSNKWVISGSGLT